MAEELRSLPPRGKFLVRHHELTLKHFKATQDDQTVVLKAHLLLEGMFRDFCCNSVPAPEHLQGARLTFKQISLLARSLNPRQEALSLWPAVNHLNSLRNAMAHELEPSADKIAKLQRLIITNIEAQSGGKPGTYSLVEAIGFLCGFMSAHLQHALDPDNGDEGQPIQS